MHFVKQYCRECKTHYIIKKCILKCLVICRVSHKTYKNWNAARDHCEGLGQTLATFETLESANWFVHLRKTNTGTLGNRTRTNNCNNGVTISKKSYFLLWLPVINISENIWVYSLESRWSELLALNKLCKTSVEFCSDALYTHCNNLTTLH